jgi:hypothetical protein
MPSHERKSVSLSFVSPNRLGETQTPDELNMEDDDVIDARTTARTILAPDALTAALAAVPAEDWCRTWAADRTIMLRMTSKTVKEAVDKVRPPAVVLLSRSFLDDARHGTAAEKLQFVFRQITALTAWLLHHHTRTAALCNGRTTECAFCLTATG